jgi:fructosamine-3-kinase
LNETFRKDDPRAPQDFFAVEAHGLDWLRAAEAVSVPRVVSVGRDHIELERIARGPWTPAVDERFGRELADLHRAGAPTFGGRGGAYIGPHAVPNEPAESWPAFYAGQRLEPFLYSMPKGMRDPIERVIARIEELAGPAEPPARLHGDLWRGNVLADPAGTPWVIDPAAHGGHRETDLAMMRLFGGFGDRSFAAYDETFPLADGWRDRIALHQLHPLLVHCALFGGAYIDQALAAARCYA